MKSVLVLEDGTYFAGEAFGAEGEVFGEVVFNTCMTGYQGILTDPSYNGQMVAMTYPLIGNYGFEIDDEEFAKSYINGFIVKELCNNPSIKGNAGDAGNFFKKNNITGIKGIDTRALTQHIRKFGSMYGVISTVSGNIDILLDKLNKCKQQKRDLVMEVTTRSVKHIPGSGKRIVLLDFGVNKNIIYSLKKRNCEIYILPADSALDDIMDYKPDGVLLSNGPGDPGDVPFAKNVVEQLPGKVPVMGVGLGYQLLALAFNCKVEKLEFGHHGANYPVRDHGRGRCYVTYQNHNFALVDIRDDNIVITHENVNDGTIEGFRHKHLPILGIQYYPELGPGEWDSGYVYDEFMKMMNV